MKIGGVLSTLSKISVIITGGGTSSRFGENKLLYELNGKPLIINTIEKFINIADEIVIPTSDEVKDVIKKYYPDIVFAPSGKCRQKSVLNALNKLKYKDYVLIHDGARPFISVDIIKKVIEEVKVKKAVIVGVRAIDTVKICDEKGQIINTPNRSTLFYAQTPQAFDFKIIYDAHKMYENELETFTDDAGLIEKQKKSVYIVEGDYGNKKITTKYDVNC